MEKIPDPKYKIGDDIVKYLFWLLANMMWFGLFAYLIVLKDWSMWSLLIPICFHWEIEEIK